MAGNNVPCGPCCAQSRILSNEGYWSLNVDKFFDQDLCYTATHLVLNSCSCCCCCCCCCWGDLFKQDATLSQGPPRDAPNI